MVFEWQRLSSFGIISKLLPDSEVFVDLEGSEEPWIKSDIALRQSVLTLASKLDELHDITYTALKHRATAFGFAQESISKLRALLDNLRSDIDGYWDREDSYEQHGSIWDSLLHVISTVAALETACN